MAVSSNRIKRPPVAVWANGNFKHCIATTVTPTGLKGLWHSPHICSYSNQKTLIDTPDINNWTYKDTNKAQKYLALLLCRFFLNNISFYQVVLAI